MGMRIKKVLGYGLTDVATKDHRIVDSRINPGSRLFGYDNDLTGSYTAFLDAAIARGDADAMFDRASLGDLLRSNRHINSPCVWDGEYGLPKVLVVQSMGIPQWTRYDDPIDFVEETAFRDEPIRRVVKLEGGIFPYSGLYMDARTGQRLKEPLGTAWRHARNRHGSVDPLGILGRLATPLGFKSAAEADRYIVPYVPEEIRRVCEWGELFTDPGVWRQLRPLLYVYWA